jgi:general secretion pathway protein D
MNNKVLFSASLVLIAVFAISGCDLAENNLKHDREAALEFQDYRDALSSRLPEKEDDVDTASIPSLQPYIAEPAENTRSMPLVSISVNQTVPLRDVLFELAEQADYDIELDPRIRGSIIFTARERPFDQVVARISDIAGLRYKFKDDYLRVELDTPYNKLYKADFLSYIRTSSGGIRNDVNVVSGDGADTGSNFEATSQSEANFWAELDANLTQILGGGTTSSLMTSRDPRISVADQNPDVRAVSPTGDDSINVQPPDAVLNVDSLPVDDYDTGSSNSSNNSGENPYAPTFTLNRQAGLINVYATERLHKEVREYLNILKQSVSAQVLIEAKILEVTLNDQFETGIDWRFLDLGNGVVNFFDDGSLIGVLDPTTIPLPVAGQVFSGGTNFAAGYRGGEFEALIQALQGFGTVKGLASPRMTVLNNQPAVLNVATNQVFFEIDIDRTEGTDGAGDTTDIDSDIRNVPEGVLVNVQPSINLDEGTVSLAVRPTITRVVGVENDPAIQFVTASADPPITGVVSEIPELNVQEIDTVINLRSGQAAVLGGLLQDRITNTEEGVPILSEIPLAGGLFKDHSDLVSKTELVIFLKATILNSPGDSVHNTDKDLYRRFSSDRRPFKL